MDVAIREGDSVLLQCAGKSSQDSGLNIRWRGPDGQDIGIVGDSFRTQLTNGSLYISSVEENRSLTGPYQCLLTSEGIGTIVSRPAVVSIARPPELHQETAEMYLNPGQTAYFQCLSVPQAEKSIQVQWLKDDLPLRLDDSRMVVLPSGALEIDDVTASDRGAYSCNVTYGPSLEAQSAKIHLNIRATGLPESFKAPSFLSVPTPQTIREGDSITMDCIANGNPKPVIRWLRDGEDIDMSDLDSRFRIIGTGSLHIYEARETDSGEYQCRAINSEDSLDATASLQVQIPPRFRQRPSDKKAQEKEELELVCEIEGKPTPHIQWLKNGDVITPNEYMQIVNGHNLRILGLLPTDSGMFQCVGSNPAGTVQAAARLQIVTPGTRLLKTLLLFPGDPKEGLWI